MRSFVRTGVAGRGGGGGGGCSADTSGGCRYLGRLPFVLGRPQDLSVAALHLGRAPQLWFRNWGLRDKLLNRRRSDRLGGRRLRLDCLHRRGFRHGGRHLGRERQPGERGERTIRAVGAHLGGLAGNALGQVVPERRSPALVELTVQRCRDQPGR